MRPQHQLHLLPAVRPDLSVGHRAGGVCGCRRGHFLYALSDSFGLLTVCDRHEKKSCVARRFLFGVLFSGCLSCLVMHGLWLVLLQRRGRGPRSWMLWLGALGLWLVEVIINTEWLILTEVRNPSSEPTVPDLPCIIANQDFVMALIYVMVLLLAVILIALPSLKHKHKQWRRDGAFILVTGFFTSVIWVTWIVMYTYGNRASGHASWDDPTLGIAVVSNAWIFLCFYAIPEVCLLTQQDSEQEQPPDGEHVYPARTLVYGPNLKEPEPTQQNLYVENKAFSMDEASIDSTKPVSPYGVYNGQPQTCVYQPTEIALIAKHLKGMDRGPVIPRATAPPLNPGSGRSSLSRSIESLTSQELS
ncbi:G-protein coupled receptor family C group 5 member C isoform X3 [Oryzias melastigma]|uniref:G-protein coupled receptor family C group 5 member C isoform X3 n=1 Tax=Oryzias melastigma TaxID=30732 RepID=UPI000CF81135|nr:G-protein coupled receptor family C group 5 member C isoform X3 [Oryzias melastigma]XP_024128005.1 G-protein coupled receptor family C group 5 member C isoform X3 [Oryzias melastigma]